MRRNWTENQLLAINTFGGSLLVSAAAGSGKTAVLVERVVRMMTREQAPVPIDRILVVTYTKKAAAELKERLSGRLRELIAADPGNKWYRTQLMLLPDADISTIDSFCSSLVREFFHKLDIPRDFQIADECHLSVLRDEALSITLDELYKKDDPEFIHMAEVYSDSKNDIGLRKIVQRLYGFLRSHPFFDSWLDEKLSYYTDYSDAAKSVWGQTIFDYIAGAVKYCSEIVDTAVSMLDSEPELRAIILPLLLTYQNYFDNVTSALDGSWDDVYKAVKSFSYGVLRATGYTDHPLKLAVAEMRKEMKATVDSVISLFTGNEEECRAEIAALTPLARQLFGTVRIFDRRFSELKRQKNIADFSDLSQWTLRLLAENNDGQITFTNEAMQISGRYDVVMVDEYQDSNEVQDLIFRAVSKDNEMFVVGDSKQSIYSFRQAMPEIFIGRKNSLPLLDPAKPVFPSKVILEKNFRSRDGVTAVINYFFSHLMSDRVGDITYDETERLVPAADYPPPDFPCAELHLLETGGQNSDSNDVVEAKHIAGLISEMMGSMTVYENGVSRPIRFGDIAVLFRDTKWHVDAYSNTLMSAGIPVTTSTKEGFLCRDEIRSALNLLRAIDNPLRDVPLFSTMMSPVFGFSPDDMSLIRCSTRYGSLYSSVCKYAESGDTKTAEFLSMLKKFRTLSVTMSAEAFIGSVFEQTGFIPIASAAYGKSAVNNLHLLYEYSGSFRQGSSGGISAFIAYLDALENSGEDLPPAACTEDDLLNAVRLSTIHSSKGLEYPVCILAATARHMKDETKGDLLLHSSLGAASVLFDEQLHCSYTNMPHEALALKINRSKKSEELRLLYVALTRAKERLIILSCVDSVAKYLSKFIPSLSSADALSPHVVSRAASFSDWIMCCALLHKNGAQLRSLAGAPDGLCVSDDSSPLDIRLFDYSEDEVSTKSVEVSRRILTESVPVDTPDILRSRFDFCYDSPLCSLPVKVTASALSHRDSRGRFERELAAPQFIVDTTATGSARGTAIHKFLQYCDFSLARDDIKAEIESLVMSGRLSRAEADALTPDDISAFINSDIVSLALKGKYYREYRFTVNIPASLVDGSLLPPYSNESVILQGAVDLIVDSGASLIVVDYKTDRASNPARLTELYSRQLLLYKNAVGQCFDRPVTDCVIYSTGLKTFIKVDEINENI